MSHNASRIFSNHTDANRAVDDLLSAGFDQDDISLLMSRETRVKYYPEDESAGDGAAGGASVGAIIGGLVGLAAAAPGGVFVAGPLAGFLGGALAGAAGGGLLGALVDAGIPEEAAQAYVRRIDTGDVLVTVRTDSEARAQEARNILREADLPAPSPAVHTWSSARI